MMAQAAVDEGYVRFLDTSDRIKSEFNFDGGHLLDQLEEIDSGLHSLPPDSDEKRELLAVFYNVDEELRRKQEMENLRLHKANRCLGKDLLNCIDRENHIRDRLSNAYLMEENMKDVHQEEKGLLQEEKVILRKQRDKFKKKTVILQMKALEFQRTTDALRQDKDALLQDKSNLQQDKHSLQQENAALQKLIQELMAGQTEER